MGYDMIIGIDVLLALGIKLDFETRISTWDHAEVPMWPKHYTPEQAFHVQDPDSVASDMDCIKKILDAKYEATDLNQVVAEITYLSPLEKEQLLRLLKKFEPLFDGMLGKWKSKPYDIELREGITPYHARPYPLPRVH